MVIKMKIKVIISISLILFISCIFTNVVSSNTINSHSNYKNDLISKDNDWQQINIDGFGVPYNRGPRGIEIFNNTLVLGTVNIFTNTFFEGNQSWNIREFKELYFHYLDTENLESNGCEIWSYNGSKWNQLVGNKPEAKTAAGLGSKNNSEVGFLIKFKGYLYAGIRNDITGCQIWRTKSINSSWEAVITNGFGNKNNTWAMEAVVFNDNLFVGTFNGKDGSEIYKSEDGIDWVATVGGDSNIGNGFGFSSNFYIWSSAVYNNELYIGTNNVQGGGELWKTNDGITWKPVIAYSTWVKAFLNGADMPRGIARKSIFLKARYMALKSYLRGGIRSMTVYKDELYVGFIGDDLQVNFNLKGFGKILTFNQGLARIIQPIRRALTMGLEIWKYNKTQDKWSRPVGGIFREEFSAGFGDRYNDYCWAMYSNENYMYIGTSHLDAFNINLERNGILDWNVSWDWISGKGELWRYDGNSLEQINNDGFSDDYNVGIRELLVYKNKLYAATMNIKTGCEVWSCGI